MKRTNERVRCKAKRSKRLKSLILHFHLNVDDPLEEIFRKEEKKRSSKRMKMKVLGDLKLAESKIEECKRKSRTVLVRSRRIFLASQTSC